MNKLLYILSVISLLSCDTSQSGNSKYFTGPELSLNTICSFDDNQTGYKVIGIKDADTFVLLIDGKEQIVRLEHIDCPEKKQPYGSKAKQFASDMCFGKYVTLIHNNKYDRNRRLIAEVILPDGSNMNKEMVKNGLAWHFKKYSKNDEYAQLEIKARMNKIGLWSEPNPVPPWYWRKL